MGLEFTYIDGQTPLSEEGKEGLLFPSITTQGELDLLENNNIQKGLKWAYRTKSVDRILSEDFINQLHKKMLGDVWKWAGTFRQKQVMVGGDEDILSRFYNIPMDLRVLLDDVKTWIEYKTYPFDEIAIRFKYRLVTIHCYENGNGRHSRIMADLINENIFKQEPFTWGGSNLVAADVTRTDYISAIREAGKNDFKPLIEFARS